VELDTLLRATILFDSLAQRDSSLVSSEFNRGFGHRTDQLFILVA
jgi:hypothetical protein